MKKRTGKIIVGVIICMLLVSGVGTAQAKAAVIRLVPKSRETVAKRPKGVVKAKKVKISNRGKAVVKVQYKKDRKGGRIVFTAKKDGTASVTVTCYFSGKKSKKYHYKVKVGPVKKTTIKDKAKKAFKIQNRYRKEKNVGSLEWSDELYAFCLYRLKTSGYDKHKNLTRNQNDYFGNYSHYKKLVLTENLYSGSSNPTKAMIGWKHSPKHYANLLTAGHVCGAIACYKTTWCAIFYDKDRTELKGWKDVKIRAFTVKRYDSGADCYLGDSLFAYYEEGYQDTTLEAARITKTEGKTIYLEVGKTYVFFERKAPGGYEKAEQLTVTITEEGEDIILLKS